MVTVYSDADRSSLFEIRDIPSVTQVDMVLGAFDAVVTVEGEDDKAIEKAVASVSRTRGVKEAKPLVEAQVRIQRGLEAGHRPLLVNRDQLLPNLPSSQPCLA